jgi:hypothetical protein
MAIEFVPGRHEPGLEFLFGGDANAAQHGLRELGEEALDLD